MPVQGPGGPAVLLAAAAPQVLEGAPAPLHISSFLCLLPTPCKACSACWAERGLSKLAATLRVVSNSCAEIYFCVWIQSSLRAE